MVVQAQQVLCQHMVLGKGYQCDLRELIQWRDAIWRDWLTRARCQAASRIFCNFEVSGLLGIVFGSLLHVCPKEFVQKALSTR